MESDLGVALRALRQTKQITQSELARISSVSRRTLIYWETGETLPRIPELQAVLDALKATPEEAVRIVALVNVPRGLQLTEAMQTAEAHTELAGVGDLLRAMRMRNRMTQEELAARLGLHRASVMRWENLQGYPSAENLRRICVALNACAEEEAALQRRLLTAPDVPSLSSVEEYENTAQRLERQAIHMTTPLIDLNALALKRQLVLFAPRSAHALRLLARVELAHSRWLWYEERILESRETIGRCLRGIRGRFAPEGWWLGALNLASLHATKTAGGDRAGFNMLHEWLPLFPVGGLRTPLLCDMALRMACERNLDEVDALLKEAHRYCGEDGNGSSEYKIYRAHIRVRTQGCVEAIEWLLEGAQFPDQRLTYLLMWIDALLNLGEKRAARPFMMEAQTLINAAASPLNQRQFADLGRQF